MCNEAIVVTIGLVHQILEYATAGPCCSERDGRSLVTFGSVLASVSGLEVSPSATRRHCGHVTAESTESSHSPHQCPASGLFGESAVCVCVCVCVYVCVCVVCMCVSEVSGLVTLSSLTTTPSA